MLVLNICVCIAICFVAVAEAQDEVFAWNEIQFAWPSTQTRDRALQNKEYIPEHNLPLGLARWNDRLFVTVPRWKPGIASSLNYIPLNSTDKSPVLIPYPDWEANTIPEGHPYETSVRPDAIISVFRIQVDECDRLWVMDTGVADLLGTPRQIARPAIVVFDLNTNRLIRRFEFKPTHLKDDSFFANIVVDATKDKCDDAFAYVPDLGGYAIIVYSWKENKSWKVKHHFFHFDPLAGDYNIAGVNFQWTDGIFGLGLGKVQPDGNRIMYFHPLSSTKEFSVPTAILKNETLATDADHTYYEYKLLGEKGERTQATTSVLDQKSGVLFMTQISRNGIGCWNPEKPLNPENFGLPVQNNETLVFPNDISIDREDQLWMLSDRMPLYVYKTINPLEVNYRILKAKIPDIIANTPCA